MSLKQAARLWQNSDVLLCFHARSVMCYWLVLVSLLLCVATIAVEKTVSQVTRLLEPHLGFAFLFSALCATAFGHMVYNFAIRKVGPAETTIFVNLNTL